MTMELSTRPIENMNQSEYLFTEALIEKRVHLLVHQITDKMESHLIRHLKERYANRCINEGFVLPSSIQMKNYSCGKITSQGVHIVVTFLCKVCNPATGIEVDCTVMDITKAGVHAVFTIPQEGVTPLSIYVLRDHDSRSEHFEKLQKGETVRLRILGTRFELDDPMIQAVAEFVK